MLLLVGFRCIDWAEGAKDRELRVCPGCHRVVPRWALGKRASDSSVLEHAQCVVCRGCCNIYPLLHRELGEDPLKYWRRVYGVIGKKLPRNITGFRGEEN